MKISIVGIGRVGSTIAATIVQAGIVDELVLVNRNREKAEGEALDLLHASALSPKPMEIRDGSLADTADSDIVILTVSVPVPRDITTRAKLTNGNRALIEEFVPQIAEVSPDAVLIVITNPVDVMTHFALEASGLPPSRVFGTGTLIDSARYRALLSREFKIHADDIRAYILGEHGDCQFPALSLAMVGGVHIRDNAAAARLFEETVRGGYEVVRRKGYTNFAIAQAALLIVKSIVGDWNRTMPVSTRIDGYLDVHDVCLSVPAVIGREGIVRQLEPPLAEDEIAAFHRAATAVKKMIAEA